MTSSSGATDLTEEVLTKVRMHLEYWNTATDELLD